MQFVRDLLVLRSAPDHANLTDIPSTWMDEIQAILPELELATLLNLGHNLFALTEQMKSVSHTRFLIEFLFIKLTTVKSAAGIDQILKALESGQGLTATSGSAPAAQSQATPRAMGIAPKAAVSADPLAAPPPAVSRVLKPVSTPTDAGTLWKHLTDALWGTDMRMKSLLENGFPLSMEGNVLKVGLPKEDSYYLKRLHKPENTEKITRLLKSLTGADWVVRFVVTDNAPQAPVKVPVQRAEVVARDDAPDELPREEFAPEEDAEPRETRSLPDAEQRINPMRLLDESEYVRHLHTKFQCTGIQVQRPIRGATESNTEEQ
jgi:hypothetical protein